MNRETKFAIIRDFVPRLRAQIADLSPQQLTTPYNAPEWTVAQNVHHLVDSHMNSYLRFKLILTEDNAAIRPYDQDAFALLPDAVSADVSYSLHILDGLHTRWTIMLDNITDWGKAGFHPELNQPITLDDLLDIYSNHCNAHIRQIQAVIDAMP